MDSTGVLKSDPNPAASFADGVRGVCVPDGIAGRDLLLLQPHRQRPSVSPSRAQGTILLRLMSGISDSGH